MNEYETFSRIDQLFEELCSEWIKDKARQAENPGSWTRQRKMPLSDILFCTLGKKGLSTIMELRHHFQAINKVEKTVSKQDYLRQRQNLNPEVFKILNRNYLRRFYEGQEAQEW